MPVVTLGTIIDTGEKLTVGDVERCGGLYILGKPRTGKTTLLINLALEDIEHGHGLLFIDPAADAINEILVRIPKHRQPDVILLDPTDETHAFSVNVLSCANPKSLKERNITFSSALDIFIKLFPNPQTGALDILLSKYLRNSFYPLIEHQGYTLADMPLFLTNEPFRESILRQVSYNPEVVDFWHHEYAQLPRREKLEEIESTLNRLNPLLTRDFTKYMVSQVEHTVDFARWMDTRKIVLLRLPVWLDDEMKSFIGTILISQLLKSVFLRAENHPQERILFAVYCDEFHLFASPDFAKLFTQTGKFNLMPTVAHVERLGQLKPYDPNLGATLAAPLKVLFSQAVHDSDELAPELAKDSPTEIRLERQLAISQQPFEDLLRGHKNPTIHAFMQKYLQPLQFRLEDTQEDIEGERLLRQILIDEASLLREDERREGFYNVVAARWNQSPTFEAVARTEQTIAQARRHTANLLRLHESARGLKLALRSLNTFLTAIMEGRIQPEPGEELLSQFLLAFVRRSAPVPQQAAQAFEVYLSLAYGSPQLPRPIPLPLATRCLGVSHEQLYREVEAQYSQKVYAYAEGVRREGKADRDNERQDHYEQVLRDIMTWKHLYHEYLWLTTCEAFRLLRYREVRAFLTPYFFARFAPPWYYDDANPIAPYRSIYIPSNAKPEQRELCAFLEQYREGACVTLSLLRAAYRGQREKSSNRPPPHMGPGANLPPSTPSYPNHLHMLELPAIAGMEPFHVWQVIRELNELLHTVATPNKWGSLTLALVDPNAWVDSPLHLYLDEREDALLLMAQAEADFPDSAQLRAWWPRLTEEDVRRIGRRRDLLAWAVQDHHIDVVRRNVHRQLEDYKKDQRRRNGREAQGILAQTTASAPSLPLARQRPPEEAVQSGTPELPLPYMLERVWNRVDWQTQTYLIARACDLVTYGEVVADRTFPQPTLPGIPPEEVAAAVSALMEILLEAQAQVNASQERAWQRQKEEFLKLCLWKYDGLLRLQVYQAEGRVHFRDTVERYLPARVLTAEERITLLEACRKELPPSALTALEDWVQFCRLLRLPENHLIGQTTQYVEREVKTYPTEEMRKQISQELINLPRFAALARVIQEQGGVQVVRKAKIQTEELPDVDKRHLPEANRIVRQNAINAGILRPRSVIEAEGRARLERWRRRVIDSQPPPSEEPPPSHFSLKNTPMQKPLNSRDVEQTKDPVEAISASPSLQGLGQHAAEQPQPDEILPPPALELVSFTFFESGKGSLPVAHHRYSTRFPKSAARFINYQLTVKNLQQEYDRHYIEVLRYYNPDGSLFWEGQYHLAVKANLNPLAWSRGYGWEQPGHWTPGTFRVEILIGGVKVAEGSFTIEEPPPIAEKPPATSALQLESLKCYESGKGILQKDLRFYRIWFPKETTRFVNFELTVRNRLYKQRDQTRKVVVRYYKLDGNLFTTFTPFDWVITSDTEKTWYSCSSGWEEPGHWEPGDYRVEVLIDGVAFAAGTFKIQKPRRRRG